ncbi:unnamed protein product [Caenorhabditis brenneri]
MADQPITYKSDIIYVKKRRGTLEKSNENGVECEWNVERLSNKHSSFNEYSFWWCFDWTELNKAGVDGLSGHITVTAHSGVFSPRKIEVNITAIYQTIETSIEADDSLVGNAVMFEYYLLPYRLQNQKKDSYGAMFFPSKLNDTILVIDGRKLNVNSVFLSYYSEFFRALFSSKFKEGQMDEIPIKDVSYADFELLMNTTFTMTVFLNDNTVEKLLELADRFLIPSVIGHVEYHLLHNTRINSEKIIWMADKYGMSKLFEKCMRELDTVAKAKKLHTSPEYKKLSKDAKAEILDILMKMI